MGWFDDIIDTVKDTAAGAWNTVNEGVIKPVTGTVMNEVVKPVIGGAVKVLTPVVNAGVSVVNKVVGTGEKLIDGQVKFIGGLQDATLNGLNGIGNGIGNLLSTPVLLMAGAGGILLLIMLNNRK